MLSERITTVVRGRALNPTGMAVFARGRYVADSTSDSLTSGTTGFPLSRGSKLQSFIHRICHVVRSALHVSTCAC